MARTVNYVARTTHRIVNAVVKTTKTVGRTVAKAVTGVAKATYNFVGKNAASSVVFSRLGGLGRLGMGKLLKGASNDWATRMGTHFNPDMLSTCFDFATGEMADKLIYGG